MLLHRRHLGGRQNIVHEHHVVLSKCATIHRALRLLDKATLRSISRYPVGHGRFQNNPRLGALRALPTAKKQARPVSLACSLYQSIVQSIFGSMIDANALRARLSLDFTVPRLQSVISAISSYDLPSSSRRTNTCR